MPSWLMTSHSIELIHPDWPAPGQVNAVATTRLGGYSLNPFDGFNLADHVGDSLASVEANRALLREQLGLSSEPCWLNQTHSTYVTTLGDENGYLSNSDAAICREKGRIAVVMTADCLPILLCNQEGTEVAAIHAGWRGLVDGIIGNTISEMESDPARLIAWIGPAISQKRFEVGEDVYNFFVNTDETSTVFFNANRPGHWLCDLPGLAKNKLVRYGVKQVYLSGLCSYDDASRFYSYRRNKVTGRMACLIWINSDA